ncbi:MAG: segregation ATPase, FtsK/SpoIIIE family, partial [Verrucomicrobiales bacterium]|nr:segregation ATPase, FtsK/SpoIIIE family [Verrucomicrobiales bacterium]
RQASQLATSIAQALATARRLQELGSVRIRTRHAQQIEQIETETRQRIHGLNQIWDTALQEAAAARESAPKRLDEKWRRIVAKNERWFAGQTAQTGQSHSTRHQSVEEQGRQKIQELKDAHQSIVTKWTAEQDAAWQQLAADWKSQITPIVERIQVANELAENAFPSWDVQSWREWAPSKAFQNAAKFGRVNADLKTFADSFPTDPRLPLPSGGKVSLPLVLTYPEQGSILFETKSESTAAIASINNIIFRLLAAFPVGKLSFTIIDPVKLGQNFATVMHLADYEENLIGGRIWTQPNQIEEQLRDLNEHMEKVIQMYLRNEYATIAEYNLEAGNIAEKYHFVVIADFPANFTDAAARRLLHIAASGARCGVYTLIHWDQRQPAPVDFLPEDLRKSSVCLTLGGDQFLLTHPSLKRVNLAIDQPPAPAIATDFLRKVGEANRGSNRVEVPFSQVAPPATELWSESTTEELRVPIGRSGATKLQYLSMGRGTRQHALIAGKTGSGKSTLFHVIITNLALWCSPEEVEFYLIDFKKGVEFKGYADARLPHARVVAIESDREFGLSVLQRVDEELKLRGELFRKLGVQDVPGYKRAGGTQPMPRSLLMIDEFQELFVEDDRISQAAAMLLDRIVRQGRAFGIHVILGSQTLGGAYTLARTTIGQMVIRIALQCNEADAYLIMDENNPAPRLLSRPGEGIYNDMAGNIEGNSPFQAVWISDAERDEYLGRVRSLADAQSTAYLGPIVFEGNAPADIRENRLLQSMLEVPAQAPSTAPRVWLGAPNSIKGPTQAVFEHRSGNNLLMVGQRDEAVLAMLAASFIALSAQFPVGSVRFVLLESTPPGSNESLFLDRLIDSIPHRIERPRPGDLEEAMKSLSESLKSRNDQEQGSAATTFLFIHGLQNFKKLRAEDDFSFSTEAGENPATQLNKLITEGPSHGMHLIVTLDTYNNVNRFLGRKAMSEFEMRVLFQMSANDSASLCDDPKASQLGLHRALFFNEHEGYLETFRPYAIPNAEWILATGRSLRSAAPTESAK